MDFLAEDDRKKFNKLISIPEVRARSWDDAVNFTIECCMTFSDTTAGLVDHRHVAHVRHHKNDRGHQTGGFPGSVQGHHIENDWGNALLMQFSLDRGQHWVFNALYQYWISDDDLTHERWDKAFVTIDGS